MREQRGEQAGSEAVPRSASGFALRLDAYGPILLALYFLAASRWGSYAFPGPPYIGDIVLIALISNRAMLAATGVTGRGGRSAAVVLLGAALIAWSLIRLAFGEYSIDALRDVAPYLYVVVAFLVVPLDDHQEGIVRRLITAALVFHAAWVTATVLVGKLPVAPTIPWTTRGETFVFATRADFDTFALGLLAALALHRGLSGRAPVVNLVLAAWALTVILAGLQARAAFAAVVVQLLIVVALAPIRGRERARISSPRGSRRFDPRLAVAILVVVLPVAPILARDAPVIRMIPHALSPDEARPFFPTNADATTRARFRAWPRLASWIGADTGRTVVGVGMGGNYNLESGALRFLSTLQLEEIRTPHNYWLNTWARLGIVGAVIVVMLWLAGLLLALRVIRASTPLRDSDLLATLIVATLPIPATFGVLLESPFAAIPYFWAVGHLSVRACALGVTPRFSELVRSSPRSARRPDAAATRPG